MSDQTTNWDLPWPELGDNANIETAVKPLADRLDTVLTNIFGTDPATAAAHLPGHEFGYDYITDTVTGFDDDDPTTIIESASHTFDGGDMMFQFYAPDASLGAGTYLSLELLLDGSLSFGIVGSVEAKGLVNVQRRLTGVGGAHTFELIGYGHSAAAIVAGNGTGGNFAPAFMRFTKV